MIGVTAITTDLLVEAAFRTIGFALLAATLAGGIALVYRWTSTDPIPDGIAVLFGVAAVAVWLNTQSALQDAIIGDSSLTDPTTAVYTIAVFAVSAVAADAGRRLGDRIAGDVIGITAPQSLKDVQELVRTAGFVASVQLPLEIGVVEGYDPVEQRVLAEIAGETMLVPRFLDSADMERRLEDRLESDYGIGRAVVEVDEAGTVQSVAVGSVPAGIGPSLAPGHVAIAVRADPPPDASPGDAVRLWTLTEDGPRRVATGEVRGHRDDVVTVALTESAAADVDPGEEYRLVTLPGSADAGRELLSLVRAADETVTPVTVGDGHPLAGKAVDAISAAVLAIERDGSVIALPDLEEHIEPGDTVYLLAHPETIEGVA